MQTRFSAPVLRTLRASALIDERISGALSAIHGVSLRDVMLMLYVRNSHGSKLSRIDLAKRLCVSASTVTRATNPLEKIGLIARESDSRDARLSYVVLTKTGSKLLKNAEKTLEHLSIDFLSPKLSEKELTQLNQLLSKLTSDFPGDVI
jgi:DNA-binding MarR family transcriptional regulator